jgi:hypothetical protein
VIIRRGPVRGNRADTHLDTEDDVVELVVPEDEDTVEVVLDVDAVVEADVVEDL